MCKTLKKCYFDNLTYEKLYMAYKRAVKGKRKKKECVYFEMNLETNLVKIYQELRTLTYTPGKYKTFTIYEPKERLIMSLPFKDRIVHQWYIEEFIKPFFVKRFIQDSYACVPGKGTHKAVFKFQCYLRQMIKQGEFYILKCDIQKFFPSIHKEILYKILKRDIQDKYLLSLTEKIIFDDSSNGLPIGNYTSQYFANIYLNDLDHYLRDFLKIKYFIRYMDDFVILLKDKEECKELLVKIKMFLEENLELKLNKKTRYFKFKRVNQFEKGKGSKKEVYYSINSYFAYLNYTRCYCLKNVLINRIKELL